jgi:hypothetical protein
MGNKIGKKGPELTRCEISSNTNKNATRIESDLLNHLVLEDLLLIYDLDGYRLASPEVPCVLDLGKCAFTYGPAQLIIPNKSTHLGCIDSLPCDPYVIVGSFCAWSNCFTVLCGNLDCYS